MALDAFDIERFLSIPLEDRNYDDCLAAVKLYGEYVKYVPEVKMTEEVCLCAVMSYAYNLGSIPESKRTLRICVEACKRNIDLVILVPKKFINKEIVQLIFVSDRKNDFTNYIPEELRMFI
jgi:hypothetical protein